MKQNQINSKAQSAFDVDELQRKLQESSKPKNDEDFNKKRKNHYKNEFHRAMSAGKLSEENKE